MSLLLLGSIKGAPGVTTLTVVLAAVWPRRAVVADADPWGGDLTARLRGQDGRPLANDRGLRSLAAALAADPDPAQAWEHTQRADGGLDVLTGLGPAGGDGAAWPPLGAALARLGADVLTDAGRLPPTSPALALFPAASGLLLLTRPGLDALVHLRAAAAWLRPLGPPPTGLVILGDPPAVPAMTAALAAHRIDLPVLGTIPVDHRGAAALWDEWGPRLDRAPLVRAARHLALTVAEAPTRDRAPVGAVR